MTGCSSANQCSGGTSFEIKHSEMVDQYRPPAWILFNDHSLSRFMETFEDTRTEMDLGHPDFPRQLSRPNWLSRLGTSCSAGKNHFNHSLKSFVRPPAYQVRRTKLFCQAQVIGDHPILC